MGLKDCHKLLKELAPGAFRPRPLSAFRGQRVAIDGHNWAYTRMAIAHKEIVSQTNILVAEPDRQATLKLWLKQTLDFLLTLLEYGITPIFVLDGEHPALKTGTKKKRVEKKQQAIQEAQALRQQLQTADPLMVQTGLVKKLKELMGMDTRIAKTEIALLATVVAGLGFPCIQATGDGEKLCASLCIEGWVAAVISADTDNYALGTPLVLTPKFEEKVGGVHQMLGVETKELVTALGFSFEEFVDWCITIGCDFNTNMPRVGVKKAYDYITRWRRLENFPAQYDTSCLNYPQCRELFQYVPSYLLVVGPLQLNMGPMNTDPILGGIRDQLELYGLTRELDLVAYWSRLLPPPPEIVQSKPMVQAVLKIVEA